MYTAFNNKWGCCVVRGSPRVPFVFALSIVILAIHIIYTIHILYIQFQPTKTYAII